ncbi:MAG: response regulator transcription factor [Deltaproteobacteria bacterium]|nr:response regulator transcription factor [Deltaproteobacteria bacterium]
MKTMRVLLADDHPLFRKGLASLLSTEKGFKVVGEAQDGVEALNKAQDLKPDLVLMDIYMPGGNGLEATRRIKEALSSVKVVILTVSEEDKNLFEAIKCGAHGYLAKKIEPRDLFEMLRGVFRGEAPISRATAAKILDEFAAQAHRAPQEMPEEKLSPKEREVIELLTKGWTNKEIGNKLGITENTVKNHLKNILDKLHLENRVQAAAFALKKKINKEEELAK